MKLILISMRKLSWGEVYYGLKRGYLDIHFIFDNYGKDKIALFSEDRYIELMLSFEEDYFEVLKIIKQYIYNDDGTYIDHNELDFIETNDYKYLPEKYRFFLDELYELSIIDEIIDSKISVLEKFYQLYLKHSDVNYKEEWRKFINFYFNGSKEFNEDNLFNDLIIYSKELKKKCKVDA